MAAASSTPTPSIPHTPQLVESFITSGKNRGLSSHTLRWYTGILDPFARAYPELPDSREVIEAYIGSYNTGDERRHGVYRVLKAFYNYTCDSPAIPNPMLNMKPPQLRPKEKQALTIEQLKQLLEYPGHNDMVRAFLYVLADTGARLGEVAQLTGKDIGDATVTLRGKTGTRIVPVSPEVRGMLIAIMPASTAKDQRLFPHTTLWFSHLVTRSMKAAGLEGFSGHSLRHTWCTLFDGTDTALKQITGHRSWAMVDRYRHRKDAHAAEQHRTHGPLAKLNGGECSPHEVQLSSAHQGTNNLQTIIELAQQLGAAQERIKYLESLLAPSTILGVMKKN